MLTLSSAIPSPDSWLNVKTCDSFQQSIFKTGFPSSMDSCEGVMLSYSCRLTKKSKANIQKQNKLNNLKSEFQNILYSVPIFYFNHIFKNHKYLHAQPTIISYNEIRQFFFRSETPLFCFRIQYLAKIKCQQEFCITHEKHPRWKC